MSTAIITTGTAPVSIDAASIDAASVDAPSSVPVPSVPVSASAHINAAGSAGPRLRLTPRGRRVFTTLAALPLVIVALAFALNGGVATASSDGSTVPVETVTVGAGQSLWELASEIAPQADPRDVIADLVSFNHLTTTQITPGQQLDVPNRYAS